ncbi:MAG TPA: asparagine synthase C-terminal domain-containing protein, partial [Myxococcota bacterium]|nr:asparagine synthase C-terminal domain-containing protein [Myxococcota bacterium]
ARVAERLGTDHHEVVVPTGDGVDIFERVVAAIDQPSIDGTNTWLVAQAARQSVTVALSGLGADELFGGYAHFRWLAQDAQVAEGWLPGERRIAEAVFRNLPHGAVLRYMYRRAGPVGRLAMLRNAGGTLGPADILHPTLAANAHGRLASVHRPWLRVDADPIQQTTYAEVRGYLLSTLLRDNDVMSMAHSLEVRPVMLHHPLAELAYALPARCKRRGGLGKLVLREALDDLLPEEVRTGRKLGFEMPFRTWMRTGLRSRIEALLHTPSAERLFSPPYLRQVRTRVRRDDPPRALWAWSVLLGWMQHTGSEVP